MENFTFHNPTKIVFGKGSIASLPELLPKDGSVLVTYGGGSIKRNGVFDQVKQALNGRHWLEFGGIEANPRYETLMKAVDVCRGADITFLLAVGGGSVLDGTKLVAATVHFPGDDPWDILSKHVPVTRALPLGSVLTLPATGSESNGNAVITRASTEEKLAFSSTAVFPKFAILDPQTTFSLPERQTQNGIIDAFAHVMEQYMTYPVNAPLQDRQAEAILLTLIEEGPKVLANPSDYGTRANIMWCATQALNNLIGCGVPQDWTTHMIGHELTALYGLDHGQTLAVVMPAVWHHCQNAKQAKLLQYGARVWEIHKWSEKDRIEAAISRTEEFFRSLGAKTRLSEYGITEGLERVGQRIEARGMKLGEHGAWGRADVDAIIELCRT